MARDLLGNDIRFIKKVGDRDGKVRKKYYLA